MRLLILRCFAPLCTVLCLRPLFCAIYGSQRWPCFMRCFFYSKILEVTLLCAVFAPKSQREPCFCAKHEDNLPAPRLLSGFPYSKTPQITNEGSSWSYYTKRVVLRCGCCFGFPLGIKKKREEKQENTHVPTMVRGHMHGPVSGARSDFGISAPHNRAPPEASAQKSAVQFCFTWGY